MRFSEKGVATAAYGPQRRGLWVILGSVAILFAAQAGMSPAEPAPASSVEVRAKTNGIAAARALQPVATYVAPAASPDDVAPGFKLIGVFTEMSGKGSAIVAFGDDRQQGFSVGQELAPGVVLQSIQQDGVTLGRGGATYSVRLGRGLDPRQPAVPAGSAGHQRLAEAPLPLPVPAAARTTEYAPDRRDAPSPSAKSWRSALDGINFAARRNGKDVTGALVQPTSGESARIVGLLAGDVVLAVGGKKIGSTDAVAGIGRELAARRDVVVQVERGQRVQRLHLRGAGDGLD